MNLLERAKALGINPDDRSYSSGSTFGIGDKWCPWCHKHAVRNARLLCDCQQAEAAMMREAGEEVYACFRCHEPHGKPGSLCASCSATDAEAKEMRRYRRVLIKAMYVDDGHGCVERVHPTELLISQGDRGKEDL